MLRFEKFLPHRGKQVSASGEDTDIASMVTQMSERIGNSAGAE